MHNLTRKVKKMKIDFYEHGNISDNLEVDYYTPLTLTFKENSDRYDSEIFYYRFINQESFFFFFFYHLPLLKLNLLSWKLSFLENL